MTGNICSNNIPETELHFMSNGIPCTHTHSLSHIHHGLHTDLIISALWFRVKQKQHFHNVAACATGVAVVIDMLLLLLLLLLPSTPISPNCIRLSRVCITWWLKASRCMCGYFGNTLAIIYTKQIIFVIVILLYRVIISIHVQQN